MGRIDQSLEISAGPEMRVDVGEVGDPVAVIAGAFLTRLALDRLIAEHRPDPDRRGAQALDIVQMLDQTLKVAAIVKSLGGGIKTGLQPIPREAAPIIGRIAIGEAVRQHEIDHLVFGKPGAVVCRT